MDTNGVVTINSQNGLFTQDSPQNMLKQVVQPTQVSLSSIIMNALELMPSDAQIIIDTDTREVWVTDYDVAALIEAVSNTKELAISPVVGQTGKSLEFTSDGADVGFDAEIKDAAEGLVVEVAPKFTVGALAQRVAAAMPDGKKAMIVVDQKTKKLRIFYNATHAGMAAVADDNWQEGTDGVKLTLSEPTVETETLAVFEGGSTSP